MAVADGCGPVNWPCGALMGSARDCMLSWVSCKCRTGEDLKALRALRSAVVWTGIILATVLFGLPAIPAAFLPPRGDWFLRFARGWSRTILFFSGVPVRVLH